MKYLLPGAALAVAFSLIIPLPVEAEENPWLIRGRVIGVLPDEDGALTTGGSALAGSNVDISNQYVPELDISYFFNDNIAVELILATSRHDVKATGVTVGPLTNATVDLGNVWALPPTLTLQYHFDTGGAFKPYVGAGINATLFYNEDTGSVADSIDYDSSIGPALQLGFDYDMDGVPGGWLFNVDVKKVWMQSDVTVDLTSALGSSLGLTSVIVNADVDLDPLIIGVGFGYKY